jgi:hypothetical protein
MDRTGKRHMARRADDCKPNLEGKPPARGAVIAVLDTAKAAIREQFGLLISTSLSLFAQTPARSMHRSWFPIDAVHWAPS